MDSKIASPVPLRLDSSGRFAAARRVLADAIATHAFPGCAFGVLAAGEVVLEDACGNFTYEEGSPPVSLDTIFDLASVTKVVATTAMAMLLYQRGLLDLDTPVGDILPAFVAGRRQNDYARHVRLHHLLAHNSGLPNYVEFFRTSTTSSGLLNACLELQLQAEPGTRAEYSDPGFILLGKALEVCVGEPLSSWVQREVFQPLGLSSTFFCPAADLRSLIPPTEEDSAFRHRRIQGEVQDENASVLGGVAGHAGLFSNVTDLLCFSAEIISSFRKILPSGKTANLFKAGTVEYFARRQQPEGSSRALGWDTPSQKSSSGQYFSPQSIGHLGYSGCSLWIDLDAGVAVVLLTNRTWPDRQCQLIREVRPAFHDTAREAL
jgi:CubicO group peptidase (beta-lactamase class C family)